MTGKRLHPRTGVLWNGAHGLAGRNGRAYVRPPKLPEGGFEAPSVGELSHGMSELFRYQGDGFRLSRRFV